MTSFNDELSAWRSRREELIEWVEGRLPNRDDAWGAYLPLSQRREHNKAKTEHGELTLDVFERHFVGADLGDLIGLNSIAKEKRVPLARRGHRSSWRTG